MIPVGKFGGDLDGPLENLVEVAVGIPYLMKPAAASAGPRGTRKSRQRGDRSRGLFGRLRRR